MKGMLAMMLVSALVIYLDAYLVGKFMRQMVIPGPVM